MSKEMPSTQNKYSFLPMFRKYIATQHRRMKVERKKCRWQQSPFHADEKRLRHRTPTPPSFALYQRPLFFIVVSHGLSCGVISNWGSASRYRRRPDTCGLLLRTTILRYYDTTMALSLNRPIASSHNPQPRSEKPPPCHPLSHWSYRRSKARPLFSHCIDHQEEKATLKRTKSHDISLYIYVLPATRLKHVISGRPGGCT